MLMIDNIKNYLYDKKYFINIYEDYIHIFNYKELKEFKDDLIIVSMPDFKLTIKGNSFFVTKMLANEILVKGKISSLEKKNE